MRIITRNLSLLLILCHQVLISQNWQKLPNLFGGPTEIVRANDNMIFVTVKNKGLFFSTDTGKTWQSTPVKHHVTHVLAEKNLVIAFSENKLYYSDDNCATFKSKVFYNAPSSAYLKNGIIYLSGYWSGNVFSVDTGATWSPLAYPFQSLAIENSNLYVGDQFFKVSHDGGLTWFTHSALKGINFITVDSNQVWAGKSDTIFYSQDFGDNWTVQHSEQNGFFSGLHRHRDTLYLTNRKYGPDLFRSVDNGQTWQLLNAPQPVPCRWYHDFCIFGNTLFKTGSGVFKSKNGITWIKSNQGIRHLSVEKLRASDGMLMYLSALENSRAEMACSADNGNTWKVCKDLDSTFVGWKDCTFGDGKLFAADWHYGLYVSLDTGTTWQYMNQGNSFYIQAMYYKSGKLYVSNFYNANKNSFTADNGATWTDLPNFAQDGSPIDAFYQMAGTPNALVMLANKTFRSNDNGASWSVIASDSILYYHAAATNNNFFGLRPGGIFRADSYWANTTKIKNVQFWSWSPSAWYDGRVSANNNNVYVLNKDTIYYSFDKGLTWTNDTIPDAELLMVASLPGFAFVSVDGESIWRMDLNAISISENRSNVSNLLLYPNPGSGVFTVNHTNNYTGDALITITDLSGRIIKTSFADSFPFEVDFRQAPSGIYLIEITTGEDRTYAKFAVSH